MYLPPNTISFTLVVCNPTKGHKKGVNAAKSLPIIEIFQICYPRNEVSKAHQAILKEYRDDMVKYAPDKDKPHIRECFGAIPKQLAKENKKYQYSLVKPGGRSETYLGSLQWLEDADIACRCYNTDITGLPMEGNAKDNVFKVYMADIGLLIEMLGPGTRTDILQGNLGGFKGVLTDALS